MGTKDCSSTPHAGPFSARVCVLALGSPHGDDAAGWKVAQRLATDPQIASSVHQLATPWDILHHMHPGDSVILVDACRGISEPGTVTLLDAGDAPRMTAARSSTHNAAFPDALALAHRLLGPWTNMVIVAIEVQSCEPGAGLSPAVERGVERAVAVVRDRWWEWSGSRMER